MIKRIIFLFSLLLATGAHAQVGQTVDGTHATINVGGNFTASGNANATVAAELTTQKGRWQGDYTVDYNYQQSKNKATVSLGGLEAKRNYALNDRNYLIGDLRYDYNQFRPWQHTGIAAVGWGYKLIRTKNLKVSNELTAGYRKTDFGDYAVVRDSVWIRYNNGPVTVLNKFLYEKSNIDYYKNQSAITYSLNKSVNVGIQNMYTRDVKENNITSFTLGYKF